MIDTTARTVCSGGNIPRRWETYNPVQSTSTATRPHRWTPRSGTWCKAGSATSATQAAERTNTGPAGAESGRASTRPSGPDVAGARPDEVVFTSGATESDNLAILGLAAFGEANGRRHVVSTEIEHKAVLEPLQALAARGFEITLVPPGDDGAVRPDTVRAAVRDDTLLVSVMQVNNETGVRQPVAEVATALDGHPGPLPARGRGAGLRQGTGTAALGADRPGEHQFPQGVRSNRGRSAGGTATWLRQSAAGGPNARRWTGTRLATRGHCQSRSSLASELQQQERNRRGTRAGRGCSAVRERAIGALQRLGIRIPRGAGRLPASRTEFLRRRRRLRGTHGRVA